MRAFGIIFCILNFWPTLGRAKEPLTPQIDCTWNLFLVLKKNLPKIPRELVNAGFIVQRDFVADVDNLFDPNTDPTDFVHYLFYRWADKLKSDFYKLSPEGRFLEPNIQEFEWIFRFKGKILKLNYSLTLLKTGQEIFTFRRIYLPNLTEVKLGDLKLLASDYAAHKSLVAAGLEKKSSLPNIGSGWKITEKFIEDSRPLFFKRDAVLFKVIRAIGPTLCLEPDNKCWLLVRSEYETNGPVFDVMIEGQKNAKGEIQPTRLVSDTPGTEFLTIRSRYLKAIADLLPSPFGPNPDEAVLPFVFGNKDHKIHFSKFSVTKSLILHGLNFSQLRGLLKNPLAIIVAPSSKKFNSTPRSARVQNFLILALGPDHRVFAVSVNKDSVSGELDFGSAYPIERELISIVFTSSSETKFLRDFELPPPEVNN